MPAAENYFGDIEAVVGELFAPISRISVNRLIGYLGYKFVYCGPVRIDVHRHQPARNRIDLSQFKVGQYDSLSPCAAYDWASLVWTSSASELREVSVPTSRDQLFRHGVVGYSKARRSTAYGVPCTRRIHCHR